MGEADYTDYTNLEHNCLNKNDITKISPWWFVSPALTREILKEVCTEMCKNFDLGSHRSITAVSTKNILFPLLIPTN
jgi:hypothetical protein